MRIFLGGVLGKVPRPSPAMVVALFALLIAASGAAVAAIPSSDGTITACRDNKTGALRVIDTASQTCNSKETQLAWKNGITGKVADSDKLDGKDSSEFYAAGSKVADSDKLDNMDSSEFLGTNQKAADSEKLDGLDSTAFAKSYERTVVVSPVGTDIENGQALLNAISNIADASASKPYLIHIEPATYDLANGSLTMKPWVDIEGSGELNTVITSSVSDSNCSGTVIGANNTEMRFIAVRNTGGSCSVAISNSSASPRLTYVTAEAAGRGASSVAVFNTNSSPIMTNVTATASGGFGAFGVYNTNSSNPTMTEVTADANIGVGADGGSSPTIRYSKLSGSPGSLGVSGAGTSAKVALTQLVGSPVALGGATLQCFNNYNRDMAAVSCP